MQEDFYKSSFFAYVAWSHAILSYKSEALTIWASSYKTIKHFL